MGRIPLEKLNNTRDLGGTKVQGGVIAPGRLVRSGQLGAGSESDHAWIKDNITTVIDFRTQKERDELPDPDVPGVENIHIAIVEDLTAGISREAESDMEAFAMLAQDPNAAKAYMCGTYRKFVTSETARKGYETFVRKLFEDTDGTVLWHCTVGKDRAGFAAVIVLEMLGADRETIVSDYLATNEFIEQDNRQMIAYILDQQGVSGEKYVTSLRYFFGAHEDFLNAAYDKINEEFGNFGAYIRDGLHIKKEEIEAWKQTLVVNE